MSPFRKRQVSKTRAGADRRVLVLGQDSSHASKKAKVIRLDQHAPSDHHYIVNCISRKHGNIADDCPFGDCLITKMIHTTCAIFEKLSLLTFSCVSPSDLNSMRTDVRDLIKGGFKVSWLAERLDEIYEAKLCDERSSTMDEELSENKSSIQLLEKELAVHQQRLSDIRTQLELEKAKRHPDTDGKTFNFSWKSSRTRVVAAAEMSGIKVQKENESAAQVILTNQGDIVANSLFEGTLRWCLLDTACFIYKKMHNSSLKDITLAELEAVQEHVFDLEKAQVDISWIAKGLDDMLMTKRMAEFAPLVEERNKQKMKIIVELETEMKSSEENVKELCEKLEEDKARTVSLEKVIEDAKKKVSRFFGKSLVDGI